jgi:group I intron endonuclease
MYARDNGSIYACYNLINGKVYVGQSWDFKSRIKHHKSSSKNINSKRYKSKFYNAARKYGWKNFEFIILIDNIETQEDLDSWEIYFIKFLDSMNTGYNLTEGGQGGKVSEETRKKMSENHANVFGDKNPFYGKTPTEEHTRQNGEANMKVWRIYFEDRSESIVYDLVKWCKQKHYEYSGIHKVCYGRRKSCGERYGEYGKIIKVEKIQELRCND